MQSAFNIQGASYKGANEIGLKNIIVNIPQTVKYTFEDFKIYYFDTDIIANSFGIQIINKIGVVLFVLCTLYKISTLGKKSAIALNLSCIVCIPIAANIINIFVPETRIILLTSSGMLVSTLLGVNFIYKVLGELAIGVKRIYIHEVFVAFLTFLMIWLNLLSVNADSIIMNIEKRKALFVAENIYAKVVDNSVLPDEKILIIGNATMLQGEYESPLKDKTNKYANWGLVWPDKEASLSCWDSLYKYYFGVDLNFCSFEEYVNILSTPKYKEMPCYPEKGYTDIIDGVFVVKLADIE